MAWNAEEVIDYYYGEHKKGGLLGRKNLIKLIIYHSHIEGNAYTLFDGEWSKESIAYNIGFNLIEKIYMEKDGNTQLIKIDYHKDSVVNISKQTLILPIMEDINKWVKLLENTHKEFQKNANEKRKLELEKKEKRRQLEIQNEQEALEFYNDCYKFHIKENTPSCTLFEDKNKIALIYISEDKSLNFLKIDGYQKEENNGVIEYKNLHYFERAGNVHYTTDIHGDYSSFGGSMTGGKSSKLATVGGGLLFGLMGMAIGAALTYKPAEQKPTQTSLHIDSDIRKIDDRSVILNFYSDMKRQYVDIELPQDIYNFLQTYLPEKKYGIVDELEKKTVVHQYSDLIESGNLLKVSPKNDSGLLENKNTDSTENFAKKIEKLKMMKEAGMLTDEEFDLEKKKLLASI